MNVGSDYLIFRIKAEIAANSNAYDIMCLSNITLTSKESS